MAHTEETRCAAVSFLLGGGRLPFPPYFLLSSISLMFRAPRSCAVCPAGAEEDDSGSGGRGQDRKGLR